MRQSGIEATGLPKEVIICRFGSAYSTLTVLLFDKKAHDSIQGELTALDAAGKLGEPVLRCGERVCFKDFDGKWLRAHIRNVHNGGAERNSTVDIVLEDTKEIYTQVSAATLMGLPADFKPKKHASPYFIDGLAPYHAFITHKDAINAVTAQRCADALNEMWLSKSKIAVLENLTPPQLANIGGARYSRIFVASLTVEGNTDIKSCIETSLPEYEILPWSGRQTYFDLVRHPDIVPYDGSSILVPFVSEREICEVVYIRKNRDRSLRVGLRLSSHLDQEQLLQRLLGGPSRYPSSEQIGVSSAVCLYSSNSCVQRGVILKSGKVLGIDTLEVYDTRRRDLTVYGVTHSLGDVLPHLSFFIDLSTSVSAQVPCLGDFVVVTNLRPKRDSEELFQYLYDEVKLINEPTVIGGRDVRVRPQAPPASAQGERASPEANHSEGTLPTAPQREERRPLVTREEPALPAAAGKGRTSHAAAQRERVSSAPAQRERMPPAAPRKEQPKKKPRNNMNSRVSLAEWYGLSPDQTSSLKRIYENHPLVACNIEALFSEFAVTVALKDL